MPYRDELFGPEFERSIFICEPAYNVVHREVLEPDGALYVLDMHRQVIDHPEYISTEIQKQYDLRAGHTIKAGCIASIPKTRSCARFRAWTK